MSPRIYATLYGQPATRTSIDIVVLNEPQPPPARATTVRNAPAGTLVRNDTHYIDPLGSLSWPETPQRVTVEGCRRVPGFHRGSQDVWVSGRPESRMEIGPGVDVDLMQIKAVVGGLVPQDLVFQHFYMHDLSRTGSKHTDGLQGMAGRRIIFRHGEAYRINTQPFFLRDSGRDAGGGPIEDWLFEDIYVHGSTDAFYTFRISGDDEYHVAGRYVPARVHINNCRGDKGYSIDARAAEAGCRATGYVRL